MSPNSAFGQNLVKFKECNQIPDKQIFTKLFTFVQNFLSRQMFHEVGSTKHCTVLQVNETDMNTSVIDIRPLFAYHDKQQTEIYITCLQTVHLGMMLDLEILSVDVKI